MKKKSGYLFWITGLSGSGKTSLAEKILNFIKKNVGPTIILSGDDLREIFNYNSNLIIIFMVLFIKSILG